MIKYDLFTFLNKNVVSRWERVGNYTSHIFNHLSFVIVSFQFCTREGHDEECTPICVLVIGPDFASSWTCSWLGMALEDANLIPYEKARQVWAWLKVDWLSYFRELIKQNCNQYVHSKARTRGCFYPRNENAIFCYLVLVLSSRLTIFWQVFVAMWEVGFGMIMTPVSHMWEQRPVLRLVRRNVSKMKSVRHSNSPNLTRLANSRQSSYSERAVFTYLDLSFALDPKYC